MHTRHFTEMLTLAAAITPAAFAEEVKRPNAVVIFTGERGQGDMGPGAGDLATCLTAAVRAADRPPNFAVIFTDDQGYADLSCFGGTHVCTPRIDKMAAEGSRLTCFYVAAPLCTPSRAALMVGCYPKRINMAYRAEFTVLLAADAGLDLTTSTITRPRGLPRSTRQVLWLHGRRSCIQRPRLGLTRGTIPHCHTGSWNVHSSRWIACRPKWRSVWHCRTACTIWTKE